MFVPCGSVYKSAGWAETRREQQILLELSYRQLGAINIGLLKKQQIFLTIEPSLYSFYLLYSSSMISQVLCSNQNNNG